jgi:hypothetical protein
MVSLDATEDDAMRRGSRARGALTVARRATNLTLPLLVPGIGADDHGAPMPLDNAAPLTHRFDGRTNFHRDPCSWFSRDFSAVTEGDPAAREVVRRELDLDAVAREDANVVLAHLP